MKNNILFVLFHLVFQFLHAQDHSPNLIIITSDGLRWQDIYSGLDDKLVQQDSHADELIKLYGNNSDSPSREKIMPFIWQTLVHEGAFYGNRTYKNKVDTRNYHRFSYPGYSEIFCGVFDPSVNSNKKYYNKNISILEEMNKQISYRDKIAVFSSWELFPYILNEPRSGIMVNAGWEELNGGIINPSITKLNNAHKIKPAWKGETRFDDLTWQMAMEYTKVNHPKVLFISLDDTDHFGHKGDYHGYIQALAQFDRYLKEIWDMIQNDPFYKDNTHLLITTDHGRGQYPGTWQSHGLLPARSGEIWFMEYGPGIKPVGEIKKTAQEWQASLANRMAKYCNIEFTPGKSHEDLSYPGQELISSIKP